MKCRRHLSTDKQKTAAKSAVFLSSLVSYDLIDHEAVGDRLIEQKKALP